MAEVTSDADEFRHHLQDVVAGVDQVAAGGIHARLDGNGLRGTINVDSLAQLDLDRESEWSGVWDSVPIQTAISVAQLLVIAGEDSMRAFGDLITSRRLPLYAHLSVARSSLEQLGLAAWLLEQSIEGGERVRRCLNIRLQSDSEQNKLPVGYRDGPSRSADLLAAGDHLGHQIKGKSFRTIGDPIPSKTELVRKLLGSDSAGQAMYSFLSATTHGVIWGLTHAVDPQSDVEHEGTCAANLVVRVDYIVLIAQALVLAHQSCFKAFASYCGWEIVRYQKQLLEAVEVIEEYRSRMES